MYPLALRMYAVDAEASYEVGQLEGERAWLLSGSLAQMSPNGSWGNLTRSCVYDGEI